MKRLEKASVDIRNRQILLELKQVSVALLGFSVTKRLVCWTVDWQVVGSRARRAWQLTTLIPPQWSMNG